MVVTDDGVNRRAPSVQHHQNRHSQPGDLPPTMRSRQFDRATIAPSLSYLGPGPPPQSQLLQQQQQPPLMHPAANHHVPATLPVCNASANVNSSARYYHYAPPVQELLQRQQPVQQQQQQRQQERYTTPLSQQHHQRLATSLSGGASSQSTPVTVSPNSRQYDSEYRAPYRAPSRRMPQPPQPPPQHPSQLPLRLPPHHLSPHHSQSPHLHRARPEVANYYAPIQPQPASSSAAPLVRRQALLSRRSTPQKRASKLSSASKAPKAPKPLPKSAVVIRAEREAAAHATRVAEDARIAAIREAERLRIAAEVEMNRVRAAHAAAEVARRAAEAARKAKEEEARLEALRPDFPETQIVEGVPKESAGELLVVWDFVKNFAAILKVSPGSVDLSAFERALAGVGDRDWLDAVVVREVSEGLLAVRPKRKLGKAEVRKVFEALPEFLSYEPDEVDADDRRLISIVEKLRLEVDGFYTQCSAADRVRICRELVDYACMADSLLECVQDSLDHAAEEQKKVRDEIVANRRKLEAQLKCLRDELKEYREKHGLLTTATAPEPATLEEGSAPGAGAIQLAGGSGPGEVAAVRKDNEEKADESAKANTDSLPDAALSGRKPDELAAPSITIADEPDEAGEERGANLSRKQKLEAAKEERRAEMLLREVERGEETIEQKVEKTRIALKASRSVRLRPPRETLKKGESLAVLQQPASRPRSSMAPAAHRVGVGEERSTTLAAPPRKVRLANPYIEDDDPVRTYPLGMDRARRGYWFFPDIGRLWIEDTTSSTWTYIADKEALVQLAAWFSPKYDTEVALAASLQRYMTTIEAAIARDARRQRGEGSESAAVSEDEVARPSSDEDEEACGETGKTKTRKRPRTGDAAEQTDKRRKDREGSMGVDGIAGESAPKPDGNADMESRKEKGTDSEGGNLASSLIEDVASAQLPSQKKPSRRSTRRSAGQNEDAEQSIQPSSSETSVDTETNGLTRGRQLSSRLAARRALEAKSS